MASRVSAAPATRHLRLVDAERARAIRAKAGANNRTIAMLLVSTGLLVAIGLVMVLSASSVAAYLEYGSSFIFFQRQAIYAGVGLVALLVTARMRYRVWQKLALPFVGVTSVLLLLVLHPSAGKTAYGAARWLAFGPMTIQPSEIAKLAVVVYVATILAARWKRADEPMQLFIPVVPVVGFIALLIMLQPDLGTTFIIGGTVFLVMFTAGVRLRYLIPGLAAGVGSIAVLIMSAPYRRARFLSFLHPWADPRGNGYQIAQALLALGSGGLFGRGLGESLQKWMYVPNAHTDFIFSILGEELGLLGELVVLVLFGIMLFAAIRIAASAPDTFGRLLAGGIATWLGLQIVVNLGGVTGLLPVVGVPLPLVSFGGSSLVVTLAAVGILVSVGRSSGTRARSRTRSRQVG